MVSKFYYFKILLKHRGKEYRQHQTRCSVYTASSKSFSIFFPLGEEEGKRGDRQYFPLLFKNLLLNPSVQQPLERADLVKLWVSL